MDSNMAASMRLGAPFAGVLVNRALNSLDFGV